MKKAISVTLKSENLLWLKAQAAARTGGNVSEARAISGQQSFGAVKVRSSGANAPFRKGLSQLSAASTPSA